MLYSSTKQLSHIIGASFSLNDKREVLATPFMHNLNSSAITTSIPLTEYKSIIATVIYHEGLWHVQSQTIVSERNPSPQPQLKATIQALESCLELGITNIPIYHSNGHMKRLVQVNNKNKRIDADLQKIRALTNEIGATIVSHPFIVQQNPHIQAIKSNRFDYL
jgi:hypothetical protein